MTSSRVLQVSILDACSLSTYCGFTVVNSVTELFAGVRSNSFAVAVAVLEMLPEVKVYPVKVSVALALLASEPKLLVIVPSRVCVVNVP